MHQARLHHVHNRCEESNNYFDHYKLVYDSWLQWDDESEAMPLRKE